MKFSSALFFLLGSSIPLFSEPILGAQDEVAVLLELIELGQKNLEQQQRLLKSILEFKKVREAFVQDPTSGRLAALLVRSAMKIESEVDTNHLSHIFPNEFLTEVRFFAQVGREQKISKGKA